MCISQKRNIHQTMLHVFSEPPMVFLLIQNKIQIPSPGWEGPTLQPYQPSTFCLRTSALALCSLCMEGSSPRWLPCSSLYFTQDSAQTSLPLATRSTMAHPTNPISYFIFLYNFPQYLAFSLPVINLFIVSITRTWTPQGQGFAFLSPCSHCLEWCWPTADGQSVCHMD